LAAVAVLWVSCATVNRTVIEPPLIEGATYVGNRVCADCHTNISRMFPGSAHGRYGKDDLKWAAMTGCESCHGPASRHIAGGGGRGRFIVNPRKEPEVCLRCHLEVQAEFHLPQRHPVMEGKVHCVDCHDPHGRDMRKPVGGLAMARLNESCAGCHREQARPFVFEHEAMREGCVSCHQPHGSVNARLLVERDANLCLKCHAQVQRTGGQVLIGKLDHAAYLKTGTCWSAGCHTAVHGSNVSPKMLY
jgi:predicted CXXCH cytochrome family protein